MDFIYLFRMLLKRKWIILGSAILAAGIAYFLTKNNEKKYRSTAQISTGFTISDDIKVNQENFSFYEADTKFNNAIVTITSPAVMSLVSYSLILHDLENPSPFRRLTDEQKRTPIYKEMDLEQAKEVFQKKLALKSMLTSFKPEEKRLLEFLKLYKYDYLTLAYNLSVYRLQRTDYIQIESTSSNPELSAYIVNTTFQQFLRYYKNVRSNNSQESIDTLQSLLDKKKQDLDAKSALLKGQGITDIGLESSGKMELIMNLETSLIEEKNKQTTLTFSLQKINQRLAALATGTSTTNTNKGNGGSNEELLNLRKDMNDANNAYIEGGSSSPTLLKKYNDLKTQYQNKLASIAQSNNNSVADDGKTVEATKNDLLNKKGDVELDIEASKANVESLQGRISAMTGNLTHDASKTAALNILLKDAELANKEYLEARQKYNDAIDINSSSVNNFRQILLGQPAIDPEPSKRMLIVGMSGVSVFIICVLVIVLLAYLDSSIKTPEIFSRVVNLKLLGMVNFMNLRHRNLADIVANRDNTDDPTDKKRLNVFRESLRKLRYEIEISEKKIFLFTSTQKGEGKTTLIQALSYSLSMSKKRVLIIDTNFCNNDLTIQLNADPILEKIHPNKVDTPSFLEQVRNAAKDIGVGAVFAIGSEGGDYTPSEILPRENLLKHLRVLTTEYDYIFLEGPPLNDYSDSKELAQFVDGIIAVFSSTHIIKQIDKQSMSFFRELNGKFSGAILNKVDLQNVTKS
jgi:succinoglycan biosynthesis transport protein ExoP